MFKQCLLAAALAVLPLLSLAQSQGETQSRRASQADLSGLDLVERGSYVNRDGYDVHKPAHTVSGDAPPGASAQCRDGSYSFSTSRRGTCSHHGGVSRWL